MSIFPQGLFTLVLIGLALLFGILGYFADTASGQGMLAGLSLALVAIWVGSMAWYTTYKQAQETHRVIEDIRERLEEIKESRTQRPGPCEVLGKGLDRLYRYLKLNRS